MAIGARYGSQTMSRVRFCPRSPISLIDTAMPTSGGKIGVKDRAGWWTRNDEGKLYLFTAGGLREALNGHNFEGYGLRLTGWRLTQSR